MFDLEEVVDKDSFIELMPVNFINKVNFNGPTSKHSPDRQPCWVWTAAQRGGNRRPDGSLVDPYGCVWYATDQKVRDVHKLAYELTYGVTVPNGHVVDHMCFTHLCVNPNHLRAVSARKNVTVRQQIAKSGYKGVRVGKTATSFRGTWHGKESYYVGITRTTPEQAYADRLLYIRTNVDPDWVDQGHEDFRLEDWYDVR